MKKGAKTGRQVRCVATKEYGSSLDFYKAPDGHYYKDEAVYAEYVRKAELHRQLIDKLATLFGYYDGQVFPTSLTRKLKELSFYGDEVIMRTVDCCEERIAQALKTKHFDNEYQKVSYVMAIIKNYINDVYYGRLRPPTVVKERDNSNAPIQQGVQLETIGSIKRGKDITDLLGGDDTWI